MSYRAPTCPLPCHSHALEPASAACASCGVNLCDACRVSVDSSIVCRSCVGAVRRGWARRALTVTAATALSLGLLVVALLSTSRASLVSPEPNVVHGLQAESAHEGAYELGHASTCLREPSGPGCLLGAVQVIECCPASLEGQCGPGTTACESWQPALLE